MPRELPDGPPGGFEVGYTTDDGAQLRVPLAVAAVVPFADMQPSRRFKARKGQRHLPICSGRLPMAGTWAMSRGWSATS
jgi:hypothetical protein